MRNPDLTRILFAVVVVIPTLLASVYYGLIASDVYISESRYVVRSSAPAEMLSLSTIVKAGGAASPSVEKAGMVAQYLLSRAGLESVQKSMDIKRIYSGQDPSKPVDFLSRFPGLFDDPTMENFFEYYKKHVAVFTDQSSGTSTLTVRAYDAHIAKMINQFLLDTAERVINDMNTRMRADLIGAAAREVKDAEDRLREVEAAIAQFRVSHRMVQPEQEAALYMQRLDRLQQSLLEVNFRLEQIMAAAPESPQIPVLKRQISLLKSEIEKTETRIVGRDQESLAIQSPKYQKLAVERELAAKQLGAALARLENAKNEAGRQELYLVRLADPSLPDGALEPKRIRSVVFVLIASLLLWGVLVVVIAGIRAHKGVA